VAGSIVRIHLPPPKSQRTFSPLQLNDPGRSHPSKVPPELCATRAITPKPAISSRRSTAGFPRASARPSLDGYAYGGWLFVHYLWVHLDLRRRGIGRGPIAEAEQRALVLGCHSAHLDTFWFQAPDFYKKLGYRVFGAIDYPPDHQRFFLQKRLVEDHHADAS
jgi:Acetyltransferase (GNAT) family